ncbi:MAG: hypothetical protein H7230_02025 [Candidatus Parcubacteria bacterium]|nr:hypothetical protein [Candidatus Paceibacterota bacterium]
MTPSNLTAPLSVINLYNKFRNLVGLTITQSMVYLVLLVSLFGTLQILTINTYAQSAGENNVIGSIGFKECNFVTNSGQPGAAVVSNVDAQFQKCVGSIIQFFFALALFIIAVRIGIEAFANINPAEAGKAVSNTITLVRDVTVGLLLIGSPSIFLSFFNPTTLSLAGVINLQRLSGPAKGVETTVNENGQTKTTGEGGKEILSALEYEKLTPELAAELLKDPDAFARTHKLQLNVIKEKILEDLKSGKFDRNDEKDRLLLNYLLSLYPNGESAVADIYPDIIAKARAGTYKGKSYNEIPLIASKLLENGSFRLIDTKKSGSSASKPYKVYEVNCSSGSASTKKFNEMCGTNIRLFNDQCENKPYITNPNETTNTQKSDNCFANIGIDSVGNLR